MPRNFDSFLVDRGEERPYKSLRHNAREYRETMTQQVYESPEPRGLPLPKPGRGASGESSN